MNVSELYDLTRWIEKEIIDSKIPQKYQALQAVLQQNTQPNQPKQPFESQTKDLIKTIKNVPLNQLTKEQLKFLAALKIKQAIGKEGVSKIEDILFRNALDIATAARKIQEILNNLNKGIQKSNQIKAGLSECIFWEEYEETDAVLIRVTFAGNASMSNIVDFKNWGKIWHEIGRGVAIVHDASPEDIKIIGATKGSIVIELATNPNIATTVCMIIFSALKLAEKVLDIRKKAEEIRNLELRNKQISVDIENAATEEKNKGVEQICDELKKELNIGGNNDGDKAAALNKAIKNLIDFVESGGEIDFVVPKDETEDDKEKTDVQKPEYERLKKTIQKIRTLETKLRLFESRTEENEAE